MLTLFIALLQLNGGASHAQTAIQNSKPAPDCVGAQGVLLPVDNAQVLKWKTTTPSQFLARAHVDGVVSDIYPERNGHTHFAIQLDPDPSHNLEVVYNQSFGRIPRLIMGMKIETCGDYITSDKPTTQYPASPAGAIIHWIHKNPGNHGHPSGFLMINGLVYGQGLGHGA